MWAHKDREATKAAKFKDRRSWVGSNSEGRYVRLFGKDMVALRNLVFERDRFRCVDCGPDYRFGIQHLLELSHDRPRSLGGSDTEENTHCRCRKHHRIRDGRGQPMHF